MKKAVIYARYSSDGQREESIEAQLRACYQHAEKEGIEVIREYIDRASSAKHEKVAKRTEFQKMMKDGRNQNFDFVLVHKYNRFARSRYDHVVYSHKLHENNIRLIAVAENFGTGKEAILIEGMMQALSEYYIADLADEVKKGHRENALKALHNGGYAPFGYDIVDRRYVINELEAGYVRRMYSCCLDGLGFTDLIRDMQDAGITGKRGKPVTYPSIHDILRNEKYTGVYLYCPDESKKRRDKSSAIRIDDALPAIIDRGTWEEVQKIMDSRKNTGKAAKREYLLSGRIFCECGAAMHGMTTRRKKKDKTYEYSYYVCSGKCGNRTVDVDTVHAVVFDYIKSFLHPENRAVLQDTLKKYTIEVKSTKESDKAEIEKEISGKEKQYDALMDNLASGVLGVDVVAGIGKKMEKLQEQIDVLKKELSKPISFTPNQVDRYFDAISDLGSCPEEMKKDTIRKYIEKVIVKKDDIGVISTFSEFLGKIGCAPLQPSFPKHFMGRSYPRVLKGGK